MLLLLLVNIYHLLISNFKLHKIKHVLSLVKYACEIFYVVHDLFHII